MKMLTIKSKTLNIYWKIAPYIIVLSLLGLWEFISRLRVVSPHLFPSPSLVTVKLYYMIASGVLVKEYLVTTYRVLAGFSLGVLLGIILGILIAYSRNISKALYPIIAAISVAPTLALVPLLIIWVGLNDMLAITAVFLCSFIPLTYNTVSAIRRIDPEIVDVAKTLGASKVDLTLRIFLPQSLPSILSALKLEAAMAWKTCFVTEFIALSSGLGKLMIEALNTLSVDEMLALLFVLSMSSYIFLRIFDEVEKYFLKKWGFRA